ncbi:flagellar basal-body MS-ring/collar protein FliF [Frateuria aurantia]
MADNAVAETPSKPAARLDSLRSVLATPLARQLLTLFGIAAAVAVGLWVVMWSRSPEYGLLYGGLEQRDAAAVVQSLQSSGVPYHLSPDGSSIMVPADRLATIKLKLASQGLPQAHPTADQSSGDSLFGISDFAEHNRYQHQLEADLAATISSLQAVRSARVHLALPKPSAFIRDNHPASASVVVSLYSGNQLDSGQVAAIVHLVASSVPDLDPQQVSVVNSDGQLLTSNDPESSAAIGDARLRLATRIENVYAQHIEDILSPLVGSGHVQAQVSVDVDLRQTEQASEAYGHDKTALRSEQVSSSTRTGAENQGGVPGALSNQPPNATPQPTMARPANGAGNPALNQANANSSAPAGKPSSDSSNSATRNYEIDRTVSHSTDPAGQVTRVSVAVVVDDKQTVDGKGKPKIVAYTPAELDRMTNLVKNAVGFESSRGDSVSVVDARFDASREGADADRPPFWERPGVLDLAKQALGVILVLALGFGLLRPMVRNVIRGPQPAEALAALPAGAAGTSLATIDDDDEDDVRGDTRGELSAQARISYEEKITTAKRLAADNPKQAAQIVKNWIDEDGG